VGFKGKWKKFLGIGIIFMAILGILIGMGVFYNWWGSKTNLKAEWYRDA